MIYHRYLNMNQRVKNTHPVSVPAILFLMFVPTLRAPGLALPSLPVLPGPPRPIRGCLYSVPGQSQARSERPLTVLALAAISYAAVPGENFVWVEDM